MQGAVEEQEGEGSWFESWSQEALYHAECILPSYWGLFVSSELPALKEPWNISSEGRVATASFAELIWKILEGCKVPNLLGQLFVVRSAQTCKPREQISNLFHAQDWNGEFVKRGGKTDACAQLKQAPCCCEQCRQLCQSFSWSQELFLLDQNKYTRI